MRISDWSSDVCSSDLPQDGTFARAALSYGTDDYKRITADVNAMLTEHVGARIQGVWHDQDVAGRDAIYQRRWGVAPSVTIGLGTPTRLTASYYYLESHELPDRSEEHTSELQSLMRISY